LGGRMRPMALFWPYNDAQHCRLLRIIDEYFNRSVSRPGFLGGLDFWES